MRGVNTVFLLAVILSACGGTLAIDMKTKLGTLIKSLAANGIPEIPLNMTSEMITLEGSINDLTFPGLDTTTIQKADASISFVVTVEGLAVRNLGILGTYNIDGILGDDALHLFGNGDLSVKLSDLKASLNMKLASRSYEEGGTKYAYISSLSLNISLKSCTYSPDFLDDHPIWEGDANWAWSNMDYFIQLENLLGGGQLGDLMNEVLSEFVLAVANIPEYTDELVNIVVNLVNDMLIGTTLADLLAMLTK